MAFRHGNHGVLSTKSVIWKCPTCGSENAGPLEAGCVQCKAGADARKSPLPLKGRNTVTGRSPFEQWAESNYPKGLDTGGWSIASAAWDAGAAWATGNREPLPPPLLAKAEDSQGGWILQLTHSDPATWGDPEHMASPLDPRARQTLLAALAFYRDNQLAYGAVPGQLSAEEVTELIQKLTPQEVEA